NELMACFGMPKGDAGEEQARNDAIMAATKKAAMIPLGVLERSRRVIDLAETMAQKGNRNSISDAGVGILAARCAAEGAYLNVMINIADIADPDWVAGVRERAGTCIADVRQAAEKALEVVNTALGIR
ncbi:MAG TPA: cyclodeaminase/cyclohydrolase family protein, partial [bacterium]|nr:cyclodeaminase/cyclohydrolase family protein [bacterium]